MASNEAGSSSSTDGRQAIVVTCSSPSVSSDRFYRKVYQPNDSAASRFIFGLSKAGFLHEVSLRLSVA